MKRIFVIIAFALHNIYMSVAQCIYPSSYSTVTVYTPNNLSVTAAIFNGTDPNITSGDIAAWTLYLAQNYGAVYIGNPTYTYNCHGYVWNMTNNNNPTVINSSVWINQGCLSPYMNNGGYVSCSEIEATKVYYHPDGDHSAIRLDSYWYQSKWGANYLVKHPPNSVDYIYQASKTKTYWKKASYTVSFNLSYTPSTPPASQSVLAGEYATKPSDPNRPSYTFGGWYDNSACSGAAVNFTTYKITSNKEFFAKWTSVIPPTAKVKVINNYGNQVNGNIQVPNSGFNWGISMGAYSTSPSSGWHSITLTPGTYYSVKALISNFDDPPPSYWYRYINLQFGTSESNPPLIASWTQAWDGSYQDRSISLNIANGNTYFIIITLY